MIGILRPVKNEIKNDFIGIIPKTHCSGCVAIKDEGSRPLSLFYIYEADFLLYLYFGFNKINRNYKKVICTGFPVVKKPIYELTSLEKKVLFSFSVIAAYSFLDDKIRDNNSFKAKMFLKLYEKHFDSSYSFLNNTEKPIFNPQDLLNIDETKAKNLNELCLLYRPLTAHLYYNSLKKLDIRISDNLLIEICNLLSDILIFTDSIADYFEDKKDNNFNPINSMEELNIAFYDLQNIISKLSILISVTTNPWKEIMQNILTYGIINYINKRRGKNDQR
jgi:hypothetical protein